MLSIQNYKLVFLNKIKLERMQCFGVTCDQLSCVQWKRDTNREDEIGRNRTAQMALKRTE